MRGAGLLCVFVLCGVQFDMVSCTLNDFFQNFGTKISDAWSYTWNNIVDNIKKPVKIKRLGSLGKLRTTSPAPQTSTEEQIYSEMKKKLFDLNTKSIDLNTKSNDLNTKSHDLNTEPSIKDPKLKLKTLLQLQKFLDQKTLLEQETLLEQNKLLPEIIPVKQMDDLLEKEIIGMQNLEKESRNARLTKLTIPHLRAPKWTSFEDWRRLQKPIYGSYHDNIDGREMTLTKASNPQNCRISRTSSAESNEMTLSKASNPQKYRISRTSPAEKIPLHQRLPRSDDIPSRHTFVRVKPENADYFDIVETMSKIKKNPKLHEHLFGPKTTTEPLVYRKKLEKFKSLYNIVKPFNSLLTIFSP